MKPQFAFLSALILTVIAASAEVQTGHPAPEFQGQDIAGHQHKLTELRGKVVVLEAFNPDCPFVQNHYTSGAMPQLQQWAADRGVVWLLINSTAKDSKSHRSPEQAKREWNDWKIKAAAWIDDGDASIARAYEMKTTPHMFVIDPQGNLVYEGAIDDRPKADGNPSGARNYVREALESVLAGQPVKTSSTKPYGCGVKYSRR